MIRAAPRRFRPEALFRPRSIAVLGSASAAGRLLLRNLREGGFAGAVHEFKHRADLEDFGAAVDLGVVAGSPEELQPGLDLFARLGTGVAIATTPGAWTGAACHVLGPGAFGVIVPAAGLNASLAHLQARAGKLALISPSAALCRTVLDWAGPNGVGFSHVVGTGAELDVDAAVILDVLAREPATGAILLDIRTIRDRRAFLSAARAAARLRPVVALHAGSRQQDPSGRGERVFQAALRRAGILHVATLAEFLAAAETLTRARPPRTDRLMIVTNAIGAGQLAADQAVRLGLDLTTLDPAAQTMLGLQLPPQPPDPGIVWTGDDHPTRLAEAVAMLSALPEVGGVVVVVAPTGEADAAAAAALVAAQPGLKLPMLACILGETTAALHRRTLAEAGIPVFASPEQAVRGFAQLIQQRQARAAARELPSSRVLRLAPGRAAAQRILAAARVDGRRALFQDEALDVLAAYGIPVLPGRAVVGAEEAAAAAGLLGFPAVVKQRRLDPGTLGSVVLDLPDAPAVRLAAHRLLAPDGLLVQRQAVRGQRLRVTLADDQLFGPAIAFGPGGRDRFEDAATELPPLNLALAASLVERSRAARLLQDGQSHPEADRHAVADMLVRVSQLAIDLPEIDRLTIDPVFADETGVSAAEAWIGLRPAGERSIHAIAPYPAELVEHWPLGAELLEIRPIRPEDAEAHAALFRRLSPEDVRYRFFSLLRDLSAEQVVRLTQIDYEREMAFVAVRGGETVGVARLVREPGTEAEFAIVVDPALKGRGLGRHLMYRLIGWARSRAVTAINGQVLTDNAPMLSFVRSLGFAIRRIPGEADVVEVRRTV